MVYGDLQFFDIIIFAGIAAFLIYRLRNVLGKRMGLEKKDGSKTTKPDREEGIKKDIPELKDNEKKLSLAYETIPSFDHKNFLEGAKFAFETIINAFNEGDKKTLKNLLTNEVYNAFEGAMDSGNNSPGFQFYSLVVNEVEGALVEGDTISVTLKITSEQFKDGDESTIIKKQDIWTFQKDIKNVSPIWLLSST